MTRLLTLLFLFSCLSVFPQSHRTIHNTAFARGEKLNFRVAFNSALTGSITGGKASLEVKSENKIINQRSTYHVVAEGKTTGFIEIFYKIRDRFESYFDQDALVKVPANVQDVISALYYARTLDISDLKSGGTIVIPFFLDDSVYHSRVIFKGRETVKIKLGTFKCIVFQPMVATGYAFDDPYPITIWITDDANRLPILIESEQPVGRGRVELISYSGLANPITSKLPD